jgi:hypothetical protein
LLSGAIRLRNPTEKILIFTVGEFPTLEVERLPGARGEGLPSVSCFLEKRLEELHDANRGLSLEGVNPDSFAAQDKL